MSIRFCPFLKSNCLLLINYDFGFMDKEGSERLCELETLGVNLRVSDFKPVCFLLMHCSICKPMTVGVCSINEARDCTPVVQSENLLSP